MSEKWIPSVFDKKFGPGILSHYPPGMHPLAWRYYKKNYACIPLVLISLYDYAFVAFASIYGFMRTDIRLSRCSPYQNELYDLLIHPVNRKFLTFNMKYEPQPELYNTYMDMKAEEDRRREECK
ncbi:unnamed protein product [Acanthoscelides obtectus]|uniref:Uncharacterized protein n=1 Tax=Acanthoscelides obtectus TaxID=200917 RepID=A0A9P0KXF8_ACAOB|nr:unnamed protein product [Acanthoscelides obtectus]CAK1647705.1 hypothetical protein AOBTE_LOCUS15354 [Acanthoscelides obtectus]